LIEKIQGVVILIKNAHSLDQFHAKRKLMVRPFFVVIERCHGTQAVA
jgi:hypothetical protein